MQRYRIHFCEMLYMFQAVPPPIIRRSKLYIQHRVLVKTLLLPTAIVEKLELFHYSDRQQLRFDKYPMLYKQFWAPDDGRRYRLKHVEHFTDINK
jgi:hypothetical protein